MKTVFLIFLGGFIVWGIAMILVLEYQSRVKAQMIAELKKAIKLRDEIINKLINGQIGLQERLNIQKEISRWEKLD